MKFLRLLIVCVVLLCGVAAEAVCRGGCCNGPCPVNCPAECSCGCQSSHCEARRPVRRVLFRIFHPFRARCCH